MLRFLTLDHNRLAELPSFYNLRELTALALQNNNIHSLPSETFRGLKRTVSIDVSSNNISLPIEAGVLPPRLQYLSLATNDIDYVEPGAFGKGLAHVWVSGTNVSCAQLEGDVLPQGAGCTDRGVCGAETGVTWMGNGICNAGYEPALDTEKCLRLRPVAFE